MTLRLVTRNSEDVRVLFPSHTVDIGIAELPIDYAGIDAVRYQLRCVAILPKEHALAAHETITPLLLSGAPFFAIGRERQSHHEVLHAFADARSDFNLVGEAEQFASVCAVVAGGYAVSIVDPWTAESFVDKLVVRPFEPAIKYDIAVFRSADRPPSIVAAKFMTTIDRHLREAGAVVKRVRSGPRSASDR